MFLFASASHRSASVVAIVPGPPRGRRAAASMRCLSHRHAQPTQVVVACAAPASSSQRRVTGDRVARALANAHGVACTRACVAAFLASHPLPRRMSRSSGRSGRPKYAAHAGSNWKRVTGHRVAPLQTQTHTRSVVCACACAAPLVAICPLPRRKSQSSVASARPVW